MSRHYLHKDEINKTVETDLKWSRADDFIASWITKDLTGVSITNEQDWPKMAKFLAEWSSKICNAMLPYLIPSDSKEAVFQKMSAWTREWASNRKDIFYNISHCSRTYTRFTTKDMSIILPDLQDDLSDWGTATHYFYEIYTMASGKVSVQLSINSSNITDEFRATCDEIQKYYPSQINKEDWIYRTPFKSSMISYEDITKDELFSFLDNCMSKIHDFEKDLLSKLM